MPNPVQGKEVGVLAVHPDSLASDLAFPSEAASADVRGAVSADSPGVESEVEPAGEPEVAFVGTSEVARVGTSGGVGIPAATGEYWDPCSYTRWRLKTLGERAQSLVPSGPEVGRR